jgi:alkylation response protein AidB-like acyl-CoA dehydrogenase
MPDALNATITTVDWTSLADQIGRDISEASARHDRDESFVEEGFRALRAAGFFKALVPPEFGGHGAGYR